MRSSLLSLLSVATHLAAEGSPPTISLMPDNRPVNTFTLTHPSGISATVSEHGATLRTLTVPDRDGKAENILFGPTTEEAWLANRSFFGSTVGRFANRIANGKFTLDGKEITLTHPGNGANHLHGGKTGFDKVLWKSEAPTAHSVKFTYLSPDGEEGYPGNLRVAIEYILTERSLTWKATATTDKPTPVNLTNHAFFNLTGDMEKPVLGHILHIAADSYLPVDETIIPTGQPAPVASTGFDFTTPASIGGNLARLTTSYDHNYVLTDRLEAQPAALLRDPASGRIMELSTNQPGLQFYLASPSGKTHAALCLEPQKFPDSPNRPDFHTSILRPGETYSHTITLRFPEPL